MSKRKITHINRIKVEFKVMTEPTSHRQQFNINRIKVEFKDALFMIGRS